MVDENGKRIPGVWSGGRFVPRSALIPVLRPGAPLIVVSTA